MNDKFFDLKQEKQDRMINASLKIFSRGGYRHASTDEIVKEAGISKGLLFHYFGSKLGLYGFLFDYSARFMLLELSREVKRSETDYFALTKQMEQARMQVMKLYPYMQRFLDVAVKEENTEAVERIAEKKLDYEDRLRAYSMQRVTKMVRYTIDGLTDEMSERYDFSPEKLFAEICAYLDTLRRMTIKET